ncbi:MAG: acylphosphatase [Elusimicrobia bacterium]|nr:acylphosphatase [Elusimicrobiota bacterium]
MKKMLKYNIIISGEVQGVGYRYFVVREAARFRIGGWVKNLSNGDVELLAEGEKETLDNFVNTIKTKHSWARVDDIKISKTETKEKEFKNFNIIY